jgi:hypothetical protein
MKDAHLDALSAMFDGETVDPTILREALTDPGAVDWLIDFAAWRSEFRQDPSRPSEAFYRAMAPVLRPSRWRRLLGKPRINLPVAAAFAVAAALLGFTFRPSVEPPTPVAAPVQIANTTNRGPSPPVAPQPTVEARTPNGLNLEPSRTAVILPKARPMRFGGWRESRISE